MSKRLFILSIDGVPHSLVQRAVSAGALPHFKKMLSKGSWLRMSSVLPVISSVAWATFSTGVNPGRHGIFGFVDRDPHLQYVVQTSRQFCEKSLWRRLNESGKRVIAINVPGTYPPEPIDGIIIGDFLSPSLEKAAHPASLVPLLNRLGYMIDPNPQLAVTNRPALMSEIFQALKAREALTDYLLESEEWDLFMLHVMETDRINHFFWEAMDDPQCSFHNDFWRFYAQVDSLIGRLDEQLQDDDVELMILSDHGFCAIRHDVDLNSHLAQCGFASFQSGARQLKDLRPDSVAYSLTPGRIYINRQGREALGCVSPDRVPGCCEEIAAALLALKDPITGSPIIDRVWRREEIYHGPQLHLAPELIAHPRNGYDLKALVSEQPVVFREGARSGMHTYEDALLYVRDRTLTGRQVSILDVTPAIFELLGIAAPDAIEGSRLLTQKQ